MMIKKLLTFLLFFGAHQALQAQILNPVKWHYTAEALKGDQAKIIIKAQMDAGWHIYSQHVKEGGPIPTSFKFTPSAHYQLVGSVKESPKAVSAFDKNFNMAIAWHDREVSFTQLIKTKSNAFTIAGSLEFMACNDKQCLPPEELSFSIPFASKRAPAVTVAKTMPVTSDTQTTTATSMPVVASPINPVISLPPHTLPTEQPSLGSLWTIFLAGFLGGLAAFFMPCIYPMIPLTVSFFTKKTSSRLQSIEHAIIYGLSIVFIYVALGLLITFIFGTSALNEAASSATFNLIFFVILILFAASFLGAFEINLPAGLVNRMDQKSNTGNLMGLFFMAFTLALVSFSCTGPIIGTLLVEAVSKGTYLGPAIGMFGFSLALAIPFTLFAIFPSWLKEMPKSGGWLNTIKVSLGFLELALAFKFLSNVDLAYHWHLLNRDVFLVIWIVIFGLFALYLLGKIRLEHDAEVSFVPLPRLFFAMLVLGFTIYMIPGLWGAPLKPLSAWLPPQTTQNFDLYTSCSSSDKAPSSTVERKYGNLFHAPHGLNAYYDYEEGLAYAKQVNKPVLIDFTGWSCTNCRKMEASVWADPQVLRRLQENYVLISLYVDDKTELPQTAKYTSTFSGKKIETLGQKWSDLQAATFGTNAQPYYLLVDYKGTMLAPPQAFDLDINRYLQFLDSGLEVFKRKKYE